MSNLTTIVNNIITKTNENTKYRPIGKSSMLSGTASISNTTLMAGMSTTLYTGNGSTQSINAGIDLATQWGDNASETFGGLVWIKSRNSSADHIVYDTIRGDYFIRTNQTNAETSFNALDFNANGFYLVTGDGGVNGSGSTYASWIFQTTHRVSGTTNHGKNYTCHYNPITGFTIVKYEGSGIAGHEIPHHLGRKLGFKTTKATTTTYNWVSTHIDDYYLYLNTTAALLSSTNIKIGDEIHTIVGGSPEDNSSGQTFVLYGWANSYYDADGILNGNYEVGIYQGTGASGNKIATRGKPAWLMIKRLDATGNWVIANNQMTKMLFPNTSGIESGGSNITFPFEDGFQINLGEVSDYNASGGQYLYMVVYGETDGKSKFNMTSETSNLQLTNLVASFTNGVDANGVVNTIKNLGSFTISPQGGYDV